jgi:hypothetical protein
MSREEELAPRRFVEPAPAAPGEGPANRDFIKSCLIIRLKYYAMKGKNKNKRSLPR